MAETAPIAPLARKSFSRSLKMLNHQILFVILINEKHHHSKLKKNAKWKPADQERGRNAPRRENVIVRIAIKDMNEELKEKRKLLILLHVTPLRFFLFHFYFILL